MVGRVRQTLNPNRPKPLNTLNPRAWHCDHGVGHRAAGLGLGNLLAVLQHTALQVRGVHGGRQA